MPEFLQNILSQVQGLWGKLDNTKKITLGAVLGAIVIAFVAMASFSSQPAKGIIIIMIIIIIIIFFFIISFHSSSKHARRRQMTNHHTDPAYW